MTTKFTIGIIFIWCNMLFSQTEPVQIEISKPKEPYQKSIGINLSGLFQKLARFDADTSFANPYLFTGSIRKRNRGWSIGLGGNHSQTLDQDDGFADYKKTTTTELSSRISYDFYRDLGSKWLCVISIDGIFGLNSFTNINESGIDLINLKERTTTFGLGPRLQLRYAFTKQVSLGMETYVHLRYQVLNSNRTFRNFPGLNDRIDLVQSINTQTTLPLALFIHLQL